MKIIFRSLFIVSLLTLSMFANETLVEHKKLPLNVSLPYLKSIQQYAINLGTGPTDIHVFIDPHCPRSREFVSLISQNKKMQTLYSYHLYLYELKRFNSKATITSIYAAQDTLKALLSVMVKKKKLNKTIADKKIKDKILLLEKVGKRLDVYKRPYLILVKKGKL